MFHARMSALLPCALHLPLSSLTMPWERGGRSTEGGTETIGLPSDSASVCEACPSVAAGLAESWRACNVSGGGAPPSPGAWCPTQQADQKASGGSSVKTGVGSAASERTCWSSGGLPPSLPPLLPSLPPSRHPPLSSPPRCLTPGAWMSRITRWRSFQRVHNVCVSISHPNRLCTKNHRCNRFSVRNCPSFLEAWSTRHMICEAWRSER